MNQSYLYRVKAWEVTTKNILLSKKNIMEAQLKFVKKTAFEVSMKVVVKLEDITPDEIEALFKLELLGLPVDVSFTYHQQESEWSQESEWNSEHYKLVQSLIINMKEYCKLNHRDEQEERRMLCDRYFVSSRKDMTDEQLIEAIWSYRAWILSNNT